RRSTFGFHQCGDMRIATSHSGMLQTLPNLWGNGVQIWIGSPDKSVKMGVRLLNIAASEQTNLVQEDAAWLCTMNEQPVMARGQSPSASVDAKAQQQVLHIAD